MLGALTPSVPGKTFSLSVAKISTFCTCSPASEHGAGRQQPHGALCMALVNGKESLESMEIKVSWEHWMRKLEKPHFVHESLKHLPG